MTIKKVTVKFDACAECPVYRYSGCPKAEIGDYYEIPKDCPIETSVMMYRFTEFSTRNSVPKDEE